MAKKYHKPESRSAEAKLPYSRRLKVHSGHYGHQSTSNPSSYRKPIPVPWIQLEGYWLGQAGFTIGIELEVKISQQRMVMALPFFKWAVFSDVCQWDTNPTHPNESRSLPYIVHDF